MKNLTISILLISIAILYIQNVQGKSRKGANETLPATRQNIDTENSAGIKVYYFHATRRCATCLAVEEIAKNTVEKYYKDTCQFITINREGEDKKTLIKKYNVNWQTLLVVKGEKVINLTNQAFIYANTKPGKLEEKIKSAIDSML